MTKYRPVPRRASARPFHSLSFLIIVTCALILLGAMTFGVLVPVHRFACGVVMLLALVVIEWARRK